MVFEFFTPGIARICANAGAQFVMYCMEHTGGRLRDAQAAVRAMPARSASSPWCACPPPSITSWRARSTWARSASMVPLVDTAEQAERIVSFTRYPPQGRRGAAFGFAHDDYQGGDVLAKMQAIHERHARHLHDRDARRSWRTSMRSPPCRAWTCYGSGTSTSPTSSASRATSRTRSTVTR
jgi:2-dehydro-3-deoxyglucarate aldolase/4-hydroxy-2-oxoheptanedioate aldolase